MSICLPFTEDCGTRAEDRGLFNLVGCALFLVLYLILPESMYSLIGIIGGIGVGYSAGSLFGMPFALALRAGINITASLYTMVCNRVIDTLHLYAQKICEE